jgi:hypothetical protein
MAVVSASQDWDEGEATELVCMSSEGRSSPSALEYQIPESAMLARALEAGIGLSKVQNQGVTTEVAK